MSERRSLLLSTMLAGGRQPNWMRSTLDAGGWEPWCNPGGGGGGGVEGWEPWATAGGGIENGSSSGSATTMVYDLTVADKDIDVLECGICYHPLKPPIYQCAMGHAVCSLCFDRLKDAVNCHVCRVTMPSGYQRCHAMERVVDSILMLCPHAPYGCGTRTAYHAREEHILECSHAPCHCPGYACGFVGPVATLVTHLKAAHGWPCTAETRAGESFSVDLCDGFNFLTAVRGSAQYLLLLNMASTPFGHAISAVWISSLTAMASNSSAPAARNKTCNLRLCSVKLDQYHSSKFKLESSCPSNGLPDPRASFQFFIPRYAGGTGSNEPAVHVTATIFIVHHNQAHGSST